MTHFLFIPTQQTNKVISQTMFQLPGDHRCGEGKTKQQTNFSQPHIFLDESLHWDIKNLVILINSMNN